MLLDTTTRKLQVILSSAKTTNDCPVVVTFSEITTTSFLPGVQVQNSNGLTAVDICGAPGASTQRKINYLSVYNADTVTTTAIIRFNDNGTIYEEVKIPIPIQQSLCYSDSGGWYLSPGVSSGRLLRIGVIAAGTTTYTTGAGTNRIFIRVQAAGGAGGGGSTTAAQAAVGGGGGAGGYAEKLFAVTPNTGYTCAVGTGGTAGTAGNNPGNNGGNSTFAVGATTVTAFGGTGGAGMATGTTVASSLGGAGGVVSTNGDVNAGGMPGGYSARASGTAGCSGNGGSGIFGGGGLALNAQGTGAVGIGKGSGGSGGACINGGGNVAGGAGTDGIIVVEEYA